MCQIGEASYQPCSVWSTMRTFSAFGLSYRLSQAITGTRECVCVMDTKPTRPDSPRRRNDHVGMASGESAQTPHGLQHVFDMEHRSECFVVLLHSTSRSLSRGRWPGSCCEAKQAHLQDLCAVPGNTPSESNGTRWSVIRFVWLLQFDVQCRNKSCEGLSSALRP